MVFVEQLYFIFVPVEVLFQRFVGDSLRQTRQIQVFYFVKELSLWVLNEEAGSRGVLLAIDWVGDWDLEWLWRVFGGHFAQTDRHCYEFVIFFKEV